MAVAFYDLQRGRWSFLWDSYWGGDRYRVPSSTTIGTARLTRWQPRRDANGRDLADEFDEVDVATYRTYLVPHPGEPRREFELRVALAAYVNFPRIIVDAYVEAVVGPAVHDLGELGPYLANLNGRGRTWDDHVEDVARWSQVYGWTATILEPPVSNPAPNAAEEQRLGIGLRAIHVHPTAVAWINIERDGSISEFAFCDAPYVPRESTAATYTARIYVYTPDGWGAFDVPMRVGDVLEAARLKILGDDRTGPIEPTLAGRVATPGQVPVVFAFFTEDTTSPIPIGQSAIDDAVDHARQAYNLLSWIEEIHRKTAFPFLAIPEAAAGGELAPSTRVQVGPSSALGYSSGTGAPAWVQPTAESTAELRTHALFLVMLAVRLAGLEVSLDAGAGGTESGVAIELRNRKFNSTCRRLAKNLARYEQQVFELARGILAKPGAVATCTYPKRFVLPDPSGDLARITSFIGTFGKELSPDARQACLRQAMEAALRLSDEELAALSETLRLLPSLAELTSADYDAGLVTVNEARAAKGYKPIAGGDVPVAQWVANIIGTIGQPKAPLTA